MRQLTWKEGLAWASAAIVSFNLAYAVPRCAFLFGLHLYCLLELSRAGSDRAAFNIGCGIGPLVYGPQLLFFWKVFGPTAIALWMVLAFWLGIFLLLLRFSRSRLGPHWAAVLAPVLWTGIEYFRSELYYMRFSWLNAGYVFAGSPVQSVLGILGMYGAGFVLMALAAALTLVSGRKRIYAGVAALLALAGLTNLMPAPATSPEPAGQHRLQIAGIQMEFPGELEVLQALNQLHRARPEAELLVLSEYTFTDGPIPDRIRTWCRTNRLFLAAGARDELTNGRYYNTVFVVGPTGDIVFRQAKKQPIQFFQDGLPAASQHVWESPWGRIGFCICYDLSYTRIVDELVRQGAEILIVPTMDVADWGEAQHRLHSRVAPIRAAEYGLPIFRLASSGISQWVDARGIVRASAPFPGPSAILSADMAFAGKGSLPCDRWPARTMTAVSALALAWWIGAWIRGRLASRTLAGPRPTTSGPNVQQRPA